MSRMVSAMVVELHPVGDEPTQLSDGVVAPKPQLFIFDASPQAFDKDVVHPAAFAIHADLNSVFLEFSCPFAATELAALIGVEYPRLTSCRGHRCPECPHAEAGVHGVADAGVAGVCLPGAYERKHPGTGTGWE